ncbi:hypothetical protein RCO48_25505 [Peribacillus frigoritolerans]|nr:hypothetical protein [Peribacillus frigoritolerans]
MIKETYYKVTTDTSIQDQHGNALDYSDLEIGMKVKPWHRGGVKKSFPGKAEAELILVLTDEKKLGRTKGGHCCPRSCQQSGKSAIHGSRSRPFTLRACL